LERKGYKGTAQKGGKYRKPTKDESKEKINRKSKQMKGLHKVAGDTY